MRSDLVFLTNPVRLYTPEQSSIVAQDRSQKPSYNQSSEAESAQESQLTESSKFAKKLRNRSKHTTPQPVKYPVLPRGPGSLPEHQVELLHELQVIGGAQVALS